MDLDSSPHGPRTRDSERTTADRSSVTVLNERAQTGIISDLCYEHDASGPPHAPVFTCTASCAHATGSYTCAAEGRTKNKAKTAAAAGLLDQDHRTGTVRRWRSSPRRRKRRHAARGASSGGCCGSAARWTSVTGGSRSAGPAGTALEGPLAGFTVPLLEALPVLATLDGAAANGSAALLHESARAWARAARSALAGSRGAARIPRARRRRAATAGASRGQRRMAASRMRSPRRCCGRRGRGW